MLSVEVPAPLTEAGLKAEVVPAGNPLTVRDVLPLKPFNAPTATA